MSDNTRSISTEMAELKARQARLERLLEVSSNIHSTLEPQKAFRMIISEVVRALQATSGSLVLINPTTGFLEILTAEGISQKDMQLQLRLSQGITGWVARTGKALRIGDVLNDKRYVAVGRDVRSELAVPIEVNGEPRGVLNVDSTRLEAFTETDQEWLTQVARQAAIVIQNTWLHEQLRLKAQLFESLISVSHAINSTLNLDDALRVITQEGCKLMGAKVCAVQLLDETGKWLVLRASHGGNEAYVSKPPVEVGDSLLGYVVRRQRPVQVEDVQKSSQYSQVQVARDAGLVSLLSVPLQFSQQSIGTLSVYTQKAHVFSNEEIRILMALAELSALAIEKARLYERIVDVEEQLRQSEKLSALGLLAAEVAHEIRNPLTVMKMLFHSLDLKFPGDDPRSEDVRIVSEKMELLNKIVEQILDFARSTEPKPEPVDVNQALNDLSLLTRHKLRNQGIEWKRQFLPELPPVLADPIQLEQVFLNLMLNAVEAMPEGGVLTVTTRVIEKQVDQRSRRQVLVEFSDTGQGMSLEQQDRAFSSLLQSTKPRGSGIGLALVGRIVEAHRGEVEIESEPGQGTKITVLLPAN